MSPRTPRKPPTKVPDSSLTTDLPSPRHDTSTRAAWTHGIEVSPPPGQRPASDTTLQPASFEVTAMPGAVTSLNAGDGSVSRYWLSESFVHGMQPPNAEGLRYIVGRQFVDVEHAGALRTAHVGLDESLGVYRMKLLTERFASGPVLYKNETSSTWRMTAQQAAEPSTHPTPHAREQMGDAPPAKRPRPAKVVSYIDSSLYPDRHTANAQGYHQFRSSRQDAAPTLYAFRDQYGRYVSVDPPSAGVDAQPTHLLHWTDHEIWTQYGIHGQDLERFRVQAQASGRPPQWAEPTLTDNPVNDLLADALRWLHPAMTETERRHFLQTYNLLPSQLIRLREQMKNNPLIPEWAEAHKRLTEDTANPGRLDQLSQAFVEELNLKRDGRHEWYYPETSMMPELREALLAKAGYLRNINNCLYRTDIPALFRGDERTPFELANDGTMLPRYSHGPGATTHKPLSATFSLKEGMMYASAPDPEYLTYNRQTNKYPGRAADDSSASDGSDTESTSSSEWPESGSPAAWDRERHYERTREQQKEMFLYLLDTRKLEVVPHEENMAFNSAARNNSPTWFPSDDVEGLISVSPKGLDAERIWLLNSALNKAAKVDDIRDIAGDVRAGRMEEATHSGAYNRHEYDQLIDEVETAGKPIIKLSGNKEEYGYDIVWPND